MVETYFNKFPVIAYNNCQARNISERVTLITTPRLAAIDFYPYELANNLRPDQLAGSYYQDADLDWMLYIINGIVDPYYGWHLYDLDFENYIIDKYGSIDNAEQTVIYFRNNWPSHPDHITPEYFNNLDGAFKKYFQPIWGAKQKIMSYARRPDDTTVNTNKIEAYNITMTGGTSFANGELLHLNNLGLLIGAAECISANSTYMMAKHIVMTSSTFDEIQSRANTDVTASVQQVTRIATNIPDVEGDYWEAVTWFDVERENNEYKRFVDVLDVSYVMPTAEEIRRELNK